jgi:CRP-like cAMP-binding protein
MYKDFIGTLGGSPLFKGISSESLSVMLDCLKPRIRQYKHREIIVSYGQSFNGIGIIASGKVALTRETYSGNRIMIGIFSEGDIFGETEAFSSSSVWPMTIIAYEDCVILFLPPSKVAGTCSNACGSHTTLIMNMLQILSDRASMLNKKIEYTSAKNIRGKISSYLLDIYRQTGNNIIELQMKRNELADYLGIPRPSLSREMGFMRDARMIDFNKSTIKINDVISLEESIH